MTWQQTTFEFFMAVEVLVEATVRFHSDRLKPGNHSDCGPEVVTLGAVDPGDQDGVDLMGFPFSTATRDQVEERALEELRCHLIVERWGEERPEMFDGKMVDFLREVHRRDGCEGLQAILRKLEEDAHR